MFLQKDASLFSKIDFVSNMTWICGNSGSPQSTLQNWDWSRWEFLPRGISHEGLCKPGLCVSVLFYHNIALQPFCVNIIFPFPRSPEHTYGSQQDNFDITLCFLNSIWKLGNWKALTTSRRRSGSNKRRITTSSRQKNTGLTSQFCLWLKKAAAPRVSRYWINIVDL